MIYDIFFASPAWCSTLSELSRQKMFWIQTVLIVTCYCVELPAEVRSQLETSSLLYNCHYPQHLRLIHFMCLSNYLKSWIVARWIWSLYWIRSRRSSRTVHLFLRQLLLKRDYYSDWMVQTLLESIPCVWALSRPGLTPGFRNWEELTRCFWASTSRSRRGRHSGDFPTGSMKG